MEPQTSRDGVLAAAGPLLEPLLTAVRVGVVICDVSADDQPVLYVNPTFELITGYAADEIVGRNCRVLQGPGTDAATVGAIREAIAAGRTATATIRNYRRDGTPFFNEMRLAPVPDEDGTPRLYVGMLIDVTERTEATSQLAEVETLHSSVFKILGEGIIVISPEWTVIDVNPAALEIFGRTRAEFACEDWWERLELRYTDGELLVRGHSPGNVVAREGGRAMGVRLFVRRGDGEDRLISVNYERLPSNDPEGRYGLVISFRDLTERVRADENLRQFAALVEISTDFVAIAGVDQRVRYINEAGRRLVGLSSLEEAQTKTIADFHTAEGLLASREVEQPAVLRDGHWEGEGTLRHFKTGEAIPVRINSYLVRHPESGEPWALATVQRDISEAQRVTAELVRSRERYEAQFRSLPLPTYVWQRQGDDFVMLDCNSAAESVSFGDVSHLLGAQASELFAGFPDIMLGLERCWSTHSHQTVETNWVAPRTGDPMHIVITFAWVPPDIVLGHMLDISDRIRYERRLVEMTERDDLTGLYNRRYFEQRLGEALGKRNAAVVIVDIDHFKFVNDSLGHGPGDELLREVADAMQARLRDRDVLARFGGDEFAVLLHGADEDRARAAAGHLLAAIRSKVTGVSVTASAGVAVFDREASITGSDAIVAADIALYEAKQRGRDRVELYTGQAGHSLTWLEQIRSAIAEDRLVLYGQPVIHLRGSNDPPAYELLVRMRDERGGLIAPSSFLPTAEQFGLVREIDRWVMEHGIAYAARGCRVSINLSARSLADPELPSRIEETLRTHGTRPDYVTFEFTETAAVSSVEDARAFTIALGKLGCKTALDDFGTGFGTFVLLKHLPVNALKIDIEFVRELSTSAADQRIVRSIVQIAAQAGLRTVGEGVEDAGALALLREYGVDYAQGYDIAHPAPLPD